MSGPFYSIQPAFTGGEISADVASRVDLDKYQLSLLQAENVVIKPYGSCRKRMGLKYLGETKNNGKVILQRFEFAAELSYMLEIGVGYIRIWRDGVYLSQEVSTVFTADDLTRLRCAQSVDVMYMCTGVRNVYKLMRYAEDDWQIASVTWALPPFGEINRNKSIELTPSGIKGTVTITSNTNIFKSTDVGRYIKLKQRVKSSTATGVFYENEGTSKTLKCGSSWKILTGGDWDGWVRVEMSDDDGATWETVAYYKSARNMNYSESRSVDEPCLIRFKAYNYEDHNLTVELTSAAYTNEGYAKITGYTDRKHVTVSVLKNKRFGDKSETSNFWISDWSSANGYPCAVTFFQDRLCLGGSKAFPQRIWMSRTGDYENFEVEKSSGKVLEDSAVSTDLLSLRSYKINHMYASNDLFVLTEGNTWSISGNETVTPSQITPRNQESFGSNFIEPTKIGSKVVYVQRNGCTVRDVGYSYAVDGYVGMDLTMLAKHLVHGRTIVDAAYSGQPESKLLFVRDDGVLLCLTYEPDQKVWAWSHIITDGAVEAVTTITQGNVDEIYTVVRRTINGVTKRYVEVFDNEIYSEDQQDYHMMDSYIVKDGAASATITGLNHLEGKNVWVLADGYYYDEETFTVSNGQITLPEPVEQAVVGLPYTMKIEQPNVDVGNTETGTIQGRYKTVTSAILRLVKSYGGSIGPSENVQNKIIYDPERMELGQGVLFTGDKEVVLGAGGYNKQGRTFIIQNAPYPFNLSAIIREVTM